LDKKHFFNSTDNKGVETKMAKDVSIEQELNDAKNILNKKSIKENLSQLENLLSQSNLNLYGTDRKSEVDSLNVKFNSLLHNEIDTLTQKDDSDITSFINRLYSNDKKTSAYTNMLDNQFLSMTGDEAQTLQGFLYDVYRNRLLEQNDLHEVASQLIELSEAILITRDAIISADVVEGRMSRTIKFDKLDQEDIDNTTPIVESVEKRFGLLEKIKNFIIPKTLEYGEYYAYIIPYSRIFNDFMRTKNTDMRGRKFYKETTLFESVSTEDTVITKKVKSSQKDKPIDKFLNDLYTEYKSNQPQSVDINKDEFVEDVSNILKNISICNEPVPLPILEEGQNTIHHYMTEYVNETGDKILTEEDKGTQKEIDSFFNKIINTDDSEKGITFTSSNSNEEGKKNDDFSDIKDCYLKLIDPTKIIPLKIMDQTIGYYYVQEEDITPLAGMISSTLYYNKFDEHSKQQSIIDSISQKIIDSFDKDFLKDNIKFKRTIVEAINYYNLNEKRLKFQFIPVEYIQEFKIDQDEYGNGQSMIKKSLFYAKLYLMLLLFKIMSIILNSNDQKVNYIKSSGIDKNVANKVQEIARIKQSRQINMYDLFNYTTLINKVGNGSEMYVPVGRSGERPVETEILSGQEVQLNSDLLEMLKNSYILGTGVPAAIINYLNEADFAKVIEQNNTKFNGRVVNYQLDFNSGITSMYKKILKWSTNIPQQLVDNFEFVLQPPKTVASTAKGEAINSFNQIADFLVSLLFEDPGQSEDPLTPKKIRKFKELYAAEQLPMLNMDKIKEILKKVEIDVREDTIRPKSQNGDTGEDDGLDGIDL
jgi:hypothetical protein